MKDFLLWLKSFTVQDSLQLGWIEQLATSKRQPPGLTHEAKAEVSKTAVHQVATTKRQSPFTLMLGCAGL